MWSSQASEQIEAIHAMLSSGHKSVHIERHTLIVWGLAAAGLILVVTAVFTHERFTVTWIRSAASTSFIAAVLAAVAYLDFRLIRHSRDERAESISFVQLQVTKVWWLLVGLIVLINLAMHFFGGGYMFYGLVLLLMGLALYIQGLFSRQMLSHAGVMMILLGLASISLRLPFPVMEWLTIICFGIGWPILGLSLNLRILSQSAFYRLLFSVVWLLLITLPVVVIYQSGGLNDVPDSKVVPLAQYLREPARQDSSEEVVRLPVGSTVPLNIELRGDVLQERIFTLPLQLSQPLDIAIKQGRPDGRFRLADGTWKKHIYNYRIRDYSMTTSLARENGPVVNLKLYISTNN